MTEPHLSVVIPVHNDADVVGGAVTSALDAGVDLEVVVVDDGSDDDPAGAVAAVAGDRVRVVRTANGGPSRARNVGAEHAAGTVLVFLDADDRLATGWAKPVID